ncbi:MULTISPECIES: hypothetical protein [Aeromonas]|uniref:hypothetical protein n=1 Tax=Aeromonas TaxID=642 RepID=UPI0022E0E795|nr:hypothetical protein [Aeromonas sp. QDB51]
MTTVANKDHLIGADKRRTNLLDTGQSNYDDSVVKVFRFGDLYWGQAGMVGLTQLLGLHIRGYNVTDNILNFLHQCKESKVPDEYVLGQILVYDAVNDKKFLYQSPAQHIGGAGVVIECGEIAIPFFSIGSGAEFAFPVLANGGSVEEAIAHATTHDEGTGGGIDMAHLQADLRNVVQLETQQQVHQVQANQSGDDTVQRHMMDMGLVGEDGVFTERSVSYTATKAINLAELAKMGLIKNVNSI